jgi:5-formyltetrahydrofolate cyclo-ligase
MKREKLRQKILTDRDRLTIRELELKSNAVISNLFGLEEMQGTPTIMFYASFRSEVQTMAAIESSLAVGMRVALPLSLPDERLLRPYLISDISRDLRPGFCSIPEPVPGKAEPVDPGEIEVVVIPGSVFDHNGGRLGYGGGFYDRFLVQQAGSAFRVALAFELQVVDQALPLEPHDQEVNCLVTEEKVFRFVRNSV